MKENLAQFFAQRLIQQADKVWEEQNWTDEKVNELFETKMRKNGILV